MDGDIEFDNMSRAMLSNSVFTRMQRARRELLQQSHLMTSTWAALREMSEDVISVCDLVICPVWFCAMLSLMPLPALVCLAPLYGISIPALLLIELMIMREAGCQYHRSERWLPLYFAVTVLELDVGIFAFGLQLDGMLHSPVAVAALFWVFVTMLASGVVFFGAGNCGGNRCLILNGCFALVLAISSAFLGIAALLAKVVGGMLAGIPYSVILPVMIVLVPWCSCLWTDECMV